MTDFLRGVGHDPLLMAGVRLLTPPLREVYAVLVRAGIIIIEEG
ncbi:MAG: Rv1535 domain-containing protein [Mycobacterium sp.]